MTKNTEHAFAKNIVFTFSAVCPKCKEIHEYNANIDNIYFRRTYLDFYDGPCAFINLECPDCHAKLSVNLSLNEYIGDKKYKDDKFSPTIDSAFAHRFRDKNDINS